MLRAFGIFFAGLAAFLKAFEKVGNATEEVASTLETRAKIYSIEENHKLEQRKAAFLAELEKEE